MSNKQYVTCPYCKEKLPKEKGTRKGNRYYHSNCLEKKNEEHRIKNLHSQEYKELIEYMCKELFKVDRPSGMVLKQIKQFHDEYGYRYKGMELALRYFYEVLGNKRLDEEGVGIIPYVYDEAKEHHIRKLKIAKSVEEVGNYKNSEKVVYIKPTKRKNNKIIDISSI